MVEDERGIRVKGLTYKRLEEINANAGEWFPDIDEE